MNAKGLSPEGDGESSDKPSDFRPTELVELDAEHCNKLLILLALWRKGKTSPQEFLQGFIDDMWRQLDEFVAKDLTLEDFRGIAEALLKRD